MTNPTNQSADSGRTPLAEWVRELSDLRLVPANHRDDLLQDTLLAVHRLYSDRPMDDQRRLARAILRRLAWAWRARQRDEFGAQRALHGMPERHQADPSVELERAQDMQALKRAIYDHAISALSSPERVVVFGRFYERRSVADIARELGVKDQAVYHLLRVALDRLQQALTPYRHLLEDS